MELIKSFSVDHTRIVPGIFTSRVDSVGEYKITTYDIRLKRPNIEPVIDAPAMHSLEHIIATYLRNREDIKDDVIYWGPMGCLTGFYLILKGDRAPQKLYGLILSAFKSVEGARDVPGTAPENCGSFRMHNLEMAKWYAREFVSYLEKNEKKGAIFNYPETEPVVTEKGERFYDS